MVRYIVKLTFCTRFPLVGWFLKCELYSCLEVRNILRVPHFLQVITDVTRVSNHSNSDVHMACLKCFAAILSSHAPLTEVEAWLSSSGNDSEQHHGNKPSAESTNQKTANKAPARPWVISHCLKLFGNNGTYMKIVLLRYLTPPQINPKSSTKPYKS